MKSLFYISLAIACLITLSAVSVLGENVSLAVYPSDEELYEAYLRGDIDYQTYLNLVDIFEGGIDSTDLYLLEEIPNISYFLQSLTGDFSGLEQEQQEAYIESAPEEKKKTGYFRSRAYQKLEEDGENKGYLNFKSRLNSEWSVEAGFTDNYDGDKQWSRRSAIYQARRGPVRKMIFGNYTARFGLGLAVGFRGRLLDKDEVTGLKSLAFPDYGGFNGVYIEGGRSKDAVRVMLHYDENDEFSFRCGGLDFSRQLGDFRVEGMVIASALKNRETGIKFTQYRFGSFVQYTLDNFNAAIEAAFPGESGSAIPAAVFETRLKGEDYLINFSAWNYTDDYINFTGGGRSGGLYQTVTVDTAEFDFRDRRYDQRGILLKSRVSFDGDIVYDFHFSIYGKSRFENYEQLIAAVEIPLGGVSRIRIDFRNNREKDITASTEETEIRTEYRYRPGIFDLRAYISYNQDKQDEQFMSYFSRIKYRRNGLGLLELWLNLDKVSQSRGQIDYFYGYVKETLALTASMEMAAKYSYRYNRAYSEREQSIFQLEATYRW
nr:hypothetical protein [candidate division Zixibacteria bacterium]